MSWPPGQVTPHPSDTSTKHPPPTGQKSACAPPRIISGTALIVHQPKSTWHVHIRNLNTELSLQQLETLKCYKIQTNELRIRWKQARKPCQPWPGTSQAFVPDLDCVDGRVIDLRVPAWALQVSFRAGNVGVVHSAFGFYFKVKQHWAWLGWLSMYVFHWHIQWVFPWKKKCISMHTEMRLWNHGICLVVARHFRCLHKF